MMDDFAAAEIQEGETSIFVRWSGSGSPLLARNFTVVCADLRGYGRSDCPASAPDHAPYAKREILAGLLALVRFCST